MPASHRFRSNDPQVTSPPTRPNTHDPDPQGPIGIAQARLRLAAKQHLKLVSQDHVLERKVLLGTTAINQDAKQHQEEAQHRRGSISGQARCAVWTILIDFRRPSAPSDE